MFRIEHLALWVRDLEKTRAFYIDYLGFESGEKYTNTSNSFSSYFLSHKDGPRLEIMTRPDISHTNGPRGMTLGLAHIAISVGSADAVNDLTEKLRANGVAIVGEPRNTGDGYYESVVLDPEGNRIEITI